jgi:hypothetical protein
MSPLTSLAEQPKLEHLQREDEQQARDDEQCELRRVHCAMGDIPGRRAASYSAEVFSGLTHGLPALPNSVHPRRRRLAPPQAHSLSPILPSTARTPDELLPGKPFQRKGEDPCELGLCDH